MPRCTGDKCCRCKGHDACQQVECEHATMDEKLDRLAEIFHHDEYSH